MFTATSGRGNSGRAVGLQQYSIVICFGLFLSLATIAPVSAWEYSLEDSVSQDDFQNVVSNMSDGDILILNPGVYIINNITFSHNLTIKANIANGGNQENTIIDGIGGQRGIFYSDNLNYLTIEHLTLRNGYFSDPMIIYGGGAITSLGFVSIKSCFISNCSGNISDTETGTTSGAIYTGNSLYLDSSIISNCSGEIGAILSDAPITINSSSILNCYGGNSSIILAILSEGQLSINSSHFSNCSGNGHGTLYAYNPTHNSIGFNVAVDSSTFSNCTASGPSPSGQGGAIYIDTGDVATGSVTIRSSHFSECLSENEGGAIYSVGPMNIESSTFTNCSSLGAGAIYTSGFHTVINTSTFSNCSAQAAGAIDSAGYHMAINTCSFINCKATGTSTGAVGGASITTINSSLFTNCSAPMGGGAITSRELVVNSSTFTDCWGGFDSGGGAISGISGMGGNTSVKFCTFINCSSSGLGGAINVPNYLTVYSSFFTNCSAIGGGAINGGMNPIVTDSTFFKCYSTGYGGAISEGDNLIVNSSTFSNCSSSSGGGAINGGNALSIIGSTFSNCSESSGGGWGGAIKSGSCNVKFCRFVNIGTGTVGGGTLFCGEGGGPYNLTCNWWGSNNNPSILLPYYTSGLFSDPWLMLRVSANPEFIMKTQNSSILTSLTYDSNGIYHNPAFGHVPEDIPIQYTITDGTGGIVPLNGQTVNGANTTIFTSPVTPGTATVNATVDGQTVSTVIDFTGVHSPNITAITPNTGTTGQTVSITNLSGSNFKSGTKVYLTRPGYTDIPATNLKNISSTKITCKFNLAGATAGSWNVTAINPDGQFGILLNGFTVLGKNLTVSSITPNTGYKNTTVTFSVSGTNFQNGAIVNFTNPLSSDLIATVNYPVLSTKLTGTVYIPANAPEGKWNVTVTTPDGRTATKKAAFTVKPYPQPKVNSISPTSGYRNSTVLFTLTGSNFKPGATTVNFTNYTYPGGNLTAAIASVTATKITGSVFFPANAPYGKWTINVMTPDGGTGSKAGAFTVKKWPTPTIASIKPTTGIHGTPVSFTLTGNYFEAGATTVLFNSTTAGDIPATDINVTSMTKLAGTVTLPAAGKWRLIVTTVDGGNSLKKSNGFTAM